MGLRSLRAPFLKIRLARPRTISEEVDMKREEIKITHLMRREIQAPIVSSLIKRFADEVGHDKAIGIARQVINEDAVSSGKILAEQYSGNSIAELSKVVKEIWAMDDAMTIKMIKEDENELSFDVIYCGYAEMYKEMGIKELGYVLSCDRDFPFIEGFNPAITLKRTKTIMRGAEYCDFRFIKE
jgi:hypothetical protein